MFDNLLQRRPMVGGGVDAGFTAPSFGGGIEAGASILPNTVVPKVGGIAKQSAAGADPMTALLAQLLNPMPQGAGGGTDIAKLFSSLQQAKDPVGYANKMTSLPSSAPGSMSPFNTGFFKNQQGAQVGAY